MGTKSNDGITEVTSSGSSPSGGLTDTQLRASDVKVTLDGEVVPVTGTFFQATQPVSLAVAPSTPITNANLDVALSTRLKPSDTLSKVATVDTITNPVAVTGFPATQPISATSLPLPTNAATSALQTQPGVDIGDVTINNSAGVDAVNIQDGGNSITVDGSITVIGNKSNDGGFPGSTNLGVLPAIAVSSAPLYSSNDQVALTTDTSGLLKTTGAKSNNSVGPGSSNLGVLPALVATNAPTWVNGFQSLLSVDISGGLRITGGKTSDSLAPAANNLGVLPAIATAAAPSYTEGNQVGLSTNLVGALRIASNTDTADVIDIDTDAGYISGDLAKNITQTPDGRIRTAIAALVSDVRQSFIDGEIRSLSLTSDGRLRVATSESFSYLEMFELENSFFFDVPAMSTEEAGRIDMDNNPWGI